MKLIINKEIYKNNLTGEPFNFTKIIKTSNSIYCYVNNKEIISFEDVANMDIFEVKDGEFSCPAKTKEEMQQEVNAKLLKDSANLQVELDKQKELNATLLMQIARLGGR
ncbi:hypothetical protein [Clostridium novyi]|uniref:Uncharacterized protein n=1 Tax=Clostridium novyi B str. ATCC 27606 TaxID=1443123 RepID=A0AA40M449_CLONO|nr:hypothetical protein [Clostridium novyi]KEI08180.1 hypothetical protein Z958_p0061 [Clostridium novyi B str. NCTC 9691]KEI11448.1 hypothetical protein Z959_p0010 [Clostridium novyi B str. ATCC 27606]